MIDETKKWSHAEVVFFGGTSYSVGGMKFPRNMKKRVTSVALRKKLNGVKGFSIKDFYRKPPLDPTVMLPTPEPANKTKKVKRVKR